MSHVRTTDEIRRLAGAHMAPTYAQAPFVVSHGVGSQLWDLDGNRYLDFTGGIAVNALGHCHPRVVDAIREQAGRIIHTSNLHTHPGYVALCQRLAEITCGDSVFLTNSGSEAMDAALKLARRHFHIAGSPRQRFVATHGSFHGRTLGATSITGQPSYREGYGDLLETTLVPFNDLSAATTTVDSSVAAVIVEPVQGNGGIHVASDAYLRGLSSHCRQTGTLLICDEIQTGGGRTGRWWGYEHSGIAPDMVTVAKAIGGGMPVGALVARRELMACFTPGSHGSTFGGNPVSCAAGLATLDVIAEEGLVERAEILGTAFREKLRAIGSPFVSEVRGRGLMIGLALSVAARPVRDLARERGLLITLGGPDVLRILPPLNALESEIDEAVDSLRSVLASPPSE